MASARGIAGNPAAVSKAANTLDVLYRGTDGALHDAWYTGSYWGNTGVVSGSEIPRTHPDPFVTFLALVSSPAPTSDIESRHSGQQVASSRVLWVAKTRITEHASWSLRVVS